MEDGFEDDVFADFSWTPDCHYGGTRHYIGKYRDAFLDVKWCFGDSKICIKLIGYNPCVMIEEVIDDTFSHYEKVFKKWENKENDGLVVKTSRKGLELYVSFWFETD